jgi:hypothetical protein
MKRITLLIAVFLLLIAYGNKASAQYYFYDAYSYNMPVMFELGGSVGLMNCLTDVGGKKGLGKPFVKDLNLGNNQTNGSFYFMATYREAIGLRIEGTFGNIKAHDSILLKERSTSQGRYERNLSFKSKISEISLIAEFHPLFMFIDWSVREQDPPLFSPYLAGGVGFFSFNPQAKNSKGQYVDLQPLSTEGQGFAEYPERKPYKLSQICVPIGGGIRYELGPSFNLRAEFLHRTIFTDYLDDVSTRYVYSYEDPAHSVFRKYLSGNQLRDAMELSSNQRTNTDPLTKNIYRKAEGGIRGNPKDKDSYFTFNIKLGLTFGRESIRH